MKHFLLFKLAFIILLVAEVQKISIDYNIEQQFSNKLRFERCIQIGETIEESDGYTYIEYGSNEPSPSLAKFGDGFIIVYSKDYQIQRLIVDENLEIVSKSTKYVYYTGGKNYNPWIALQKDGRYMVCFDQYISSYYVSCVFLDSSGKTISTTYIEDILNGEYTLTSIGLPKVYGFSNGYYGVFMILGYSQKSYGVIGNSEKTQIQQLSSSTAYYCQSISATEFTSNNVLYVAVAMQEYTSDGTGKIQIKVETFAIDSMNTISATKYILPSSYTITLFPSIATLSNGQLLIAFVHGSASQKAGYVVCKNDLSSCNDIVDIKTLNDIENDGVFQSQVSILKNGQILISYDFRLSSISQYQIWNLLLDPTGTNNLGQWNVDEDQIVGTYYQKPVTAISASGNVGLVCETNNNYVYMSTQKYLLNQEQDSSDDLENDIDNKFVACVVLIPCGLVFLLLIVYCKLVIPAIRKRNQSDKKVPKQVVQ